MPPLPRLQEDATGFFVWDSAAKKNIRLGTGRDRAAALTDYASFVRFKSQFPTRPYVHSGRLLLAELFVLYLQSNQKPKDVRDLHRIRRAAELAVECWGPVEAEDVTAPHVVRLQEYLSTEHKYARLTIRKTVNAIKKVYSWGFSFGHVSKDVAFSVKEAENIGAGYVPAKRRAVDPAEVDMVLPHLDEPIRTIIRVMLATGARPVEVCRMTPGMILRGGIHIFGGARFDLSKEQIWLYVPKIHKTAHHGYGKIIALNVDLQKILAPYFEDRGEDEPLFSPAERIKALHKRQRKEQIARKGFRVPKEFVKNPKRVPGKSYSAKVITRAIAVACRKAGVAPWTAYQLRYLSIGQVQADYGQEVSRAVHGQVDCAMTQHYSGQDIRTAITVAKSQKGKS